jgi:hypothetical protein
MTAQQQQALDALYALDNVLTVNITMPPSDWDNLRKEEPQGGRCGFDFVGSGRYSWGKATSVEISGTRFPARTTFNDVGIKKKSFCGSIDDRKPCLQLDFGKVSDANVPLITGLIGSRYLTLNNSIQDPSYIRQVLGYRLLGMAGLPHSRCNFARVSVNGKLVGQGYPGVNSPGMFVNAEPIMKRYIERNFNGNMDGNLYELEHRDDFTDGRVKFIGVESLSKFEDMADLKFADAQIAAHGLAGANQMLDLDQFVKLYAMEFYLKHWDGYAGNQNNTYIYNDVDAVAAPGVDNVKFKLVPWGIDQIFQPDRPFKLGDDGLIARLVRGDAGRRKQLFDQIRTYRSTIFGRDNQQKVLKPMIDQMQALLVGFGVQDAVSEIATVRQQVRLAESAGYLASGLPGPNDPVYVLKRDTSECLHASNTEGIPPETVPPVIFEVYHQPLYDNNDKADLWVFNDLGSGKSITNQAYNRVLHASDSLVTPLGNRYLYTCAPDNRDHAEEFTIVPFDSPNEFELTGYFRIQSVRTKLGATYGTDPTPGGRLRVHQENIGSRVYFY